MLLGRELVLLWVVVLWLGWLLEWLPEYECPPPVRASTATVHAQNIASAMARKRRRFMYERRITVHES